MKVINKIIFVAILMVSLSSCTLTFRPGSVNGFSGNVSFDFGRNIIDIVPDLGEGATYYDGQYIGFYITTNRAGYVTLTAKDPDGRVYVFSRNHYVEAGSNYIDGPASGRGRFQVLLPPVGYHQVRASFTASPAGRSIVYEGSYSDDIWVQRIIADLNPFPVSERGYDVTGFYVQ